MANETKAVYSGIDVSVYQGRIDWTGVKASKIDFAMIRASSGRGSPEKQTDRLFHRNVYEAAMAGVYLGAYHSNLATTVDEAHREAECFLKVIEGYRFSFPTAIDIEDRELFRLSDSRLNEVVKTWCEDLRAAGYYPMIRADADTFAHRLDSGTTDCGDVWVLHKNDAYSHTGSGMWQYAVGTVDGIESRVNLDHAYKDYPGIISSGGLNGFSTTADANVLPSSLPADKIKIALNALSELNSLMKLADTVFEAPDGRASSPSSMPKQPLAKAPVQQPVQTPEPTKKKKKFFHSDKHKK